MAKFIFITDDVDCREASKIELDVPNNLNVFEFKNMCIRMASAIGYHPNSIGKAFETKNEIEEINKELFSIFYSDTSNMISTTGSISHHIIQ